MLLEIAVFIIGIAFLFMVIFAIPTLLQFRRAAQNIDGTALTLNEKLPAILDNLDEITKDMSQTSAVIKGKMDMVSDEVDKILGVVNDTVIMGKDIRTRIESPLIETLETVTAILKGINAFLTVIRSK